MTDPTPRPSGASAADHAVAEHANGAGHAAHAPHGSPALYLTVFGLLCVLTGASFCTYTDWWRHNVPQLAGWYFMLAVAVCKALLVAMFFMHLRWEASWKYVLTIPTLFMAVFLMVALIPDIGMRYRNYDRDRILHAAVPAVPGPVAASTAEGAH